MILISNFKFQISNFRNNRGFTFIELIVVMAVFFLIIGTAIGIFISIVQHQRKILLEQELLNQTSYVMEYMSKALRMAKKDETGDCLGQAGYIYLLTRRTDDYDFPFYTGIKFINQSDNDACQEFFLDNSETPPVLKVRKNELPAAGGPIISKKFDINSIRFGVNGSNGCYGAYGADFDVCPDGASEEDSSQPKVTIVLNAQASAESPVIKIQTTVSQRDVNAQ